MTDEELLRYLGTTDDHIRLTAVVFVGVVAGIVTPRGR